MLGRYIGIELTIDITFFQTMEPSTLMCMKHDRENEILCETCHTFICPECVTEHGTDGHPAKYVHIMKYAPTAILPKIDSLVDAAKAKEKTINDEAIQLVDSLQTFIPKLVELVKVHTQSAAVLKSLASQLKTYGQQKPEAVFHDKVVAGLNSEKKRLQQVLKEKNVREVLKLAQRIESEAAITEKQETPHAIMEKIYKAIEPLQDVKIYQPLISSLEMAIAKCHFLRLVHYIKDWKCDRQYFSSKMYLSEDGLTFGNTASSGYPGIIGDTPFDTGLYAYEVIPTHLECSGKEGFGIIERDKYVSVFNSDRNTPTVYDHMIGYLYKNVAKNMTVERMADMRMDDKYYVRVNMVELVMTITGPGVSLRADLKPGVVYVPCFSCGCSSNRLKIRPLDSFDEGSDK